MFHDYSKARIDLFGQGTCQLCSRVSIEGPNGTFPGYGRVVLPEPIRDYGSISAAARSMKMSYRHAWKLMESINRQNRKPPGTMSTGSHGGGGATLTVAGEHAIEAFWYFRRDFRIFLKTHTRSCET